MVAVASDVVEEPQPVLHDRTTQREIGIPVLDQRRNIRDAETAKRVVEIVALRPLARQAQESSAAERVPSGLRDEIERRAAAIGLAEAARDRHLDFGGFADRVAETGHAAAVERRPDVHPVDLDGAFVAASAPRREEIGAHARADVQPGGLNTRHRREQVAVASRRGNRLNQRAGEDHLSSRAGLDVDHRRFAGHGDRFGHGADAHVRVDRGDARPRHVDVLALDRWRIRTDVKVSV